MNESRERLLSLIAEIKAYLEALPQLSTDDIPISEIVETANYAYGYTLALEDAIKADSLPSTREEVHDSH